jgi:hypothetical protein
MTKQGLMERIRERIDKLFYKHGYNVGTHPYIFTLIPIIITIISIFGYLNIDFDVDVRFLYSPRHAPSRREFEIHRQFTGRINKLN